MTELQVKEQLNTLLDALPLDQAELLLDFASLLRQRQVHVKKPDYLPIVDAATEWEAALAAAEAYWFQLPEITRTQYKNRTVALLRDRILDADGQLSALRRRIAAQYPEQPVLYLDANAEREPALTVHSPRLR